MSDKKDLSKLTTAGGAGASGKSALKSTAADTAAGSTLGRRTGTTTGLGASGLSGTGALAGTQKKIEE